MGSLRTVLFLGLFLLPAPVLAAENKYIVDQTISVPFSPSEVKAIISGAPGEVSIFKSEFVEISAHRTKEGKSYLVHVGSMFPSAVLSGDSLEVVFTALSKDGDLMVAPTRTWKKEDLDKLASLREGLLADTDKLRFEVARSKSEVTDIDKSIKELQVKASEIAGVEEIVALKLELSELRGAGESGESEKERLKALVEKGRSTTDPEGIHELLKELANQLAKTAEATAMADRLNERKKSAAMATLNQKLELIKEMEALDSQELAERALLLRARKRALIDSVDYSSEM